MRGDQLDDLWVHWARRAESSPDREAVVFWRAGEEPIRWTWAALLEAAGPIARRLHDVGVRQGDVCALIVRHRSWFYPTYLAVCRLGGLPAVLAYPNTRLHPAKFREGLAGMARASGLDWVLTERDLEGTISELVGVPGSTVRGLAYPGEWELRGDSMAGSPGRSARPSDPCLLQHSSGTTGLQKAVVLSHEAVMRHLRDYGNAIGMCPDDKVVSWLPLYHDMGLIAAFHLPLYWGVPTVQLDPFEWVAAPVLLLEAISREGATLSWLPNFAYHLMADRVRDEDLQGLSLASVRMFVNCSEPVRANSHERFLRRFSGQGLKTEALGACYAMAETTFAVTQTRPGEAARVARGRPRAGVAAPAAERPRVSSGFAVPGVQLRVMDETGRDLPEGEVGELLVRSPSLFDGYRGQPEKTAAVMRDGWYLTGDYGFLEDGECFVVGRKKDLIVLAGKNLYPEDVEDAIGSVTGILPGRVVAFSVEDDRMGTEVVCAVAETACEEENDRKRLRRAVVEATMAIDVTLSRVYLAPPRWLVKSSSGKPARGANRDRAILELSPAR